MTETPRDEFDAYLEQVLEQEVNNPTGDSRGEGVLEERVLGMIAKHFKDQSEYRIRFNEMKESGAVYKRIEEIKASRKRS